MNERTKKKANTKASSMNKGRNFRRNQLSADSTAYFSNGEMAKYYRACAEEV